MSIQVIGHRGARGLLPESSISGFAKALELGVDMIELDVGITRDEILVVHHDRTLNPDITRDPTGRWLDHESIAICDLTYEELTRYDIGKIKPGTDYERQFPHQQSRDGSRIPTLEDVVTLVRANRQPIIFCIEAKYLPMQPESTHPLEKFTQILVDEIVRLNLASTSIIHSFDWQITHAIRDGVPGLRAWHLTSRLPSFDTLHDSLNGIFTFGLQLSDFHGSIPEMIAAADGEVWNSDYQSLNANSIQEAQRLGLKTYAWTVNYEDDFQELYDAGIDGIITDYPDRLLKFLEKRT